MSRMQEEDTGSTASSTFAEAVHPSQLQSWGFSGVRSLAILLILCCAIMLPTTTYLPTVFCS
eukprot:Nitzschia sp. Nitz4//scaffold18_size181773//97273//98085//NITZ4_001922-RA/size181773-est2genome-gene-0.304-mRNA-1//-1//CDS//3329540032//8487//frame0